MKTIIFAIFATTLSFLLSYIVDTYHQVPSAIIICFSISLGYIFGSIGSFLEYQKSLKEIMKKLENE